MQQIALKNEKLSDLGIKELLGKEFVCECGMNHSSAVKGCDISSGAIKNVPFTVRKYNAESVYMVCDSNTYEAAGKKLCEILESDSIHCNVYMFSCRGKLEPNESAVGSAVMNYKNEDMIIGVGGGVINDICKFLKKLTQKPYAIFGTAPSMDGYASDSSSMICNGVKTTVYTCTPDEIICDIDVLKNAPRDMILAGIGDMAAKLVSICEWRISALINGEYYCEQVADIMRKYARVCCENAKKAVERDENAVKTVAEGLICAGVAMNFVKNSRPASGVEHYYSHLWEMRAIEENRESRLHGIAVGVGTLLALEKYEIMKKITPDREKALAAVKEFDILKWQSEAKKYFGKTSEAIIKIEEREHKYSADGHAKRLEKITENWDGILECMKQELVNAEYLYGIFKQIDFPLTPEDIGESKQSAEAAFLHTRDIRDKYILSRLSFDLGIDSELVK